ncbi:MAG: DUF4333 domain-containing protein, partial [Gordonia sp. (in: high G+C Gram-positive bacteria)]
PQYGQQQFAAPGQSSQPGQPSPYGQTPGAQQQFPPQQQFGQQQFGQQQFGQPGQPAADPTLNPFAPEQQTTKKKLSGSKLVGLIAAVLLALAAIVALTAFVVPGWAGKNLNQTAVQDGVTKILTASEPEGYGIKDVKDVQCPDGQKVEAGATFTCSLKVNGENKHVTVTVKDSSGTYEVSRPTN